VVRLDYGLHHPDIVFTTRAGERIEYPQGGYAVHIRLRQTTARAIYSAP